ncbi:PA14 domain-containing protein [Streptomyces thermoviolaceus]|uniref:Glycoside hydrolase family 2 n=1 Tax=Streptomyces thermoviolaceus subsp. thermoviolaceus TaxID=66860 RepID=A0ABX0YLX5_STRTL|nr:PA14 domain-containing protein [Streptomyces thermoviolaceus]NJP13434.1 glycoside hydrolase family 2 [Streptomyces thermoviolaceus subsp. thermoviolaceus]WTD46398.1 PA14 domain-containing protein [Streptomyces thermoviolaceus]GGV66673.1 hydrolase [Streptomyces thermoviolaceus subsp. apingens]GHA76896.1 hydrolase [Streptomyces thermoviolaceus subsp. thermoviolaceus]
MRTTRLRDRLALLLAGALGLAAFTSAPAAGADLADDPVEVHGLKGEYYTQSAPGAFDFHELKATAFDPSLDFDDLEPRLAATTGQSDDVSVRWTGRLVPEKTGAHTFSVSADNGFRLWVGGSLVIDHWVDDWDVEQTSAPVELTAGRAYDIKVEYFEHYGGSNLHVRWTEPGGTKEPVPQSAFLLPEGYAYDGAIAATVLGDGRTLKLDFAQKLAAPPASLTDHLNAVIGGATWPLGDARPDAGDPRAVLVELKEPVVGNKTGTARGTADVRYDGQGGLASADGHPVGAFFSSGPNRSTYELRTRWADQVGPDNALPEYPRPQLTRTQWQNLNGRWQFAAAEAGEQPPVGRNLPERILVPYPVESQLSGIERHEDRMWYRRTFTVPADWRIGHGKRLQLNFGAVDWKAEVYVNGTKVAEHQGGYDKFSADITDALVPGRTQELIVGVHDPTDAADGENPPLGKQRLDPSGIWYTPTSGIWQTVWMEPVAPDHVGSLELVPDVAHGTLSIEVQGVRDGLPVTATAYDGKRKAATVRGRTGGPLTLTIRDPHLWSPDDPFLYTLKVRVGADEVGSYFGMRSVAVENVNGVPRTLLNGEPVFMMATLDQGFWPDGLYTAPTDEALAYDLKVHKQLGFNAVRKHIKIEPDRWFYWADRLGLLVWQDIPSTTAGVTPSAAARAEFEREMKEIIDEHISSPSVVMWVTFNEGWGQYDEARIAQQAKSWDPSRLINGMSGINLGNDGGAGDILDEHGYPSPALPPHPDGKRALVSGEYGGLGLAVPGHAWSVQQSYVDVDPATYTDDYLAKLDEVRALVCRGSNGAVYTQISDVEGELNGLLTYDRAVLKPDVDRVRAAQQALIRDASRATPAGCPAV